MTQRTDLEWRDGAPVSARFGDSYFSLQGGLDESRAVYLAGCGLPARWALRRAFAVGELGFGTGLNALALWDLWRRAGPAEGRLTMVSVEAFPLDSDQARAAHAAFPQIAALSARMLAQWPAPGPGAHLLDFPDDRFRLIVIHDEALAALRNVEGRFDAWFLDGFAPAKNPDMWRADLLARVAALSAPGAIAATFTVAGLVRRGLAQAGFAVEKRPGFGRKRERLEAWLEQGADSPAEKPDGTPLARGTPVDGGVLVLGGGVAGCAVAGALAARGRDVAIVAGEAGASGVPAALLTPRLEAADRPHQRALHAAFLHAARRYDAMGAFAARGALRLAAPAERERFARIADLWPGLALEERGLVIADGGVIDPRRALAGLAGDVRRIDAHVARIARTDGLWRLLDGAGGEIAAAPVLVLAGGASGAAEALLAPLRLGLSGGQVSLHRGAAPDLATGWGGFAAPAGEGVLIGATHDALDTPAPPAPDAARARALAADAAERLGLEIAAEPERIWTGVRAVTADRLPCAGPVPAADAYALAFGAMARGGGCGGDPAGAFQPGLFTLTGLGSRGFAHAPLLAESLAAEICGEPAPLEAAGRRALHPARFLWRALKRA